MRENLEGNLSLLALCIVVLLAACSKKEEIRVSALPEVIGSELFFRGYVTDDDEELVSEIHNFSKEVTRRDTVDGRPVYVYAVNSGENGTQRTPETYFYTDEDGSVWEYNTTDLGARLVAYGFSYREPVRVKRWEPLLKMHDGVGTEWQHNIDTTFDAITMSGETHNVRYIKQGNARYEGQTETFLPEPYQNVQVLDVHWYDLNTYLIDETTSDTLFSTMGLAHHYFMPELGAVKYITNFTQSEKDKEDKSLRGTWELMRKEIPE